MFHQNIIHGTVLHGVLSEAIFLNLALRACHNFCHKLLLSIKKKKREKLKMLESKFYFVKHESNVGI